MLGRTDDVRFDRPVDKLNEQGRFEVMDRDASSIMLRHVVVGEQTIIVFVPWSNIVSIDLTT